MPKSLSLIPVGVVLAGVVLAGVVLTGAAVVAAPRAAADPAAVQLPAEGPPPLIARPLADLHGPSPFPTRKGFEQFIPVGDDVLDLFVGVSQGHEYILRPEGESSLGPQMGVAWQPARRGNLTFFGRVDLHQLTGPDDDLALPGSFDDLTESTTYTLGIGWRF